MKKLFVTLLFTFMTPVAFAHVPTVITIDTPAVKIDDFSDPMEASRAFYATFERPGDIDYYYFYLTGGDINTDETIEGMEGTLPLTVTDENGVTGRRLFLGSLVPGCGVYADILPVVAVVGPKQQYLPEYDGDMDLPFYVGSNEGVYLISNNTQGPLWYEQFTFKSYYDQNNIDIILTEPGLYRVYIWEPSGKTGDYVLEAGVVEVFEFDEILQTLFWLEHIAQDGEIGSRECKDQLEEIDGTNPNLAEIIEFYSEMFGD